MERVCCQTQIARLHAVLTRGPFLYRRLMVLYIHMSQVCIYIPAKTFTNVGMVQRVIKNRVRAPTHHTGNKSPDTRRGSLASLAIHNPCRSRFIAFKRLCIHCTQVNILRLQDTLKPLSPSLHLATCEVKVACMCTH